MNSKTYNTFIFDCDGVLLNSNKLKTQAFYDVALPYGKEFAEKLVDYHVKNGGISRYEKFAYFLQHIAKKDRVDDLELCSLLEAYAKEVWQGLLDCEVAENLEQLGQCHVNSQWLVISGGDQDELRKLFTKRNLAHIFNGGIFGSPDNKDAILSRELANENIQHPAVFFGDSQYDYEVAKRTEIDFVFVSGWSESNFGFEGANDRVEKITTFFSKNEGF